MPDLEQLLTVCDRTSISAVLELENSYEKNFSCGRVQGSYRKDCQTYKVLWSSELTYNLYPAKKRGDILQPMPVFNSEVCDTRFTKVNKKIHSKKQWASYLTRQTPHYKQLRKETAHSVEKKKKKVFEISLTEAFDTTGDRKYAVMGQIYILKW